MRDGAHGCLKPRPPDQHRYSASDGVIYVAAGSRAAKQPISAMVTETSFQGGISRYRSNDSHAISTKTAQFCLRRLNGGLHDTAENCGISSSPGDRGDILSQEQLIALARDHKFEAKLVHLEWQELRLLLADDPVLLILENGNVVTAVANDPAESTQEIIASDPLYSNGDAFFLPRNALETAWDGAALLLRRPPTAAQPGMRHFRFVSKIGTISAATVCLMLYPTDASNEASAAISQQNAEPAATIAGGDGLTTSLGEPAIAGVATDHLYPEPETGSEKALTAAPAETNFDVATADVSGFERMEQEVTDRQEEATSDYLLAIPTQSHQSKLAGSSVPVFHTDTAPLVTILRGVPSRR
jgi:hypothetical protein